MVLYPYIYTLKCFKERLYIHIDIIVSSSVSERNVQIVP
jgi:hypothetical protein